MDSFQSTGTCPRDRDLLNRLVREEAMAEAVPCNMLLEMPSGLENVFLSKDFLLTIGNAGKFWRRRVLGWRVTANWV